MTEFTFTLAAEAEATLILAKANYAAARAGALIKLQDDIAEQIELAIIRFASNPANTFPHRLDIHRNFERILLEWAFKREELDSIYKALILAGWVVGEGPHVDWLNISLSPQPKPTQDPPPETPKRGRHSVAGSNVEAQRKRKVSNQATKAIAPSPTE